MTNERVKYWVTFISKISLEFLPPVSVIGNVFHYVILSLIRNNYHMDDLLIEFLLISKVI